MPGSKSVTQRYFNLVLLSAAPATIRHPLHSEDTLQYLDALAAVGFRVERDDDEVRLTPGPTPPRAEIFCGAGGTMLRFLTAALTTLSGDWTLDGIPRLRERPLGPLVATLRQLGADITCHGAEGFAPLTIRGGTLGGGRTTVDAGASSQFLSALLMAALRAPRKISLEIDALTSAPYVELTLEAMTRFGGRFQRTSRGYDVTPSRLAGHDLVVEADDSAAAYPAAAAALAGGSVRLAGLRRDSSQGDRGFIALLAEMGAKVAWQGEELGIERGGLKAIDADLSAMPDQVPTLAALAPFATGTTRILGVPHLRLKESDRLSAMATELSRLGAKVEELHDGLVIPGVWADRPPPTTPVEVETHGDHRIAMSLALVGLRRPGVVIRSPGVVAKSYPEFWRDLRELLDS